MKATSLIVNRLATIPSIGRLVGQFVRMQGSYAIVNIGPNTVPVKAVGFYPPAVGMLVQIETVNGVMSLAGPARQLNPLGTIKSVGSPKATVTVDGKDYLLGMRSSYTPSVGDDVEINWATEIIQGKVTATASPVAPPTSATNVPTAFSDMVVQAEWSAGFYEGTQNRDDPWADASNTGAWGYGPALRDSLANSVIASAEIFLPAVALSGPVRLGLHGFAARPSSDPGGESFAVLPDANGWVPLPAGFVDWLRSNLGGVVIDSATGRNKWRGRGSDALSGALRFTGTR